MSDENKFVPVIDFSEQASEDLKKELQAETLLVDIACEFIKYRAAHNMTQTALAKKLGVTQAMVSKLESGEYNPSIKLLFELSLKLDWNFQIVFGPKTTDSNDVPKVH